jgi:hypothetical protein
MRRVGKDIGHGWIPPKLHGINITREEYDYLTGSKIHRSEPMYEVLERVINQLSNYRDQLEVKDAFLNIANADREQLKQELRILKEAIPEVV